MRSEWNTTYADRSAAEKVIEAYTEEYWKRNEDGKNYSFWLKMKELRRHLYHGVKELPNVKEITAEEFADHPVMSGSYGPTLIGSATTRFMPGIVYERYARVLMIEVNHFAGHGAAMVSVPALDTQEEWSKSQHNTVPKTMRYWSFHICDHSFRNVISLHPRNCVHTYRCQTCNWTYEIDSSG